MTEDRLTSSLQRAADELDSPISTDVEALLRRARADRRKHRIRTTVGAVAATGAVIAGSTVGLQAVTSDDETSRSEAAADGEAAPSQTEENEAGPLEHSEILARCRPQISKYAQFPMYAVEGADWKVGSTRDYAVGDVVPLVDAHGASNPVLCLVPAQGHAQEPVPFEEFEPDASDEERLLELCDARNVPHPKGAVGTRVAWRHRPQAESQQDLVTTADLRDGQVLAADEAGPVVEVLVGVHDEQFECGLSPVTWDAGPSHLTATGASGQQILFGGSTTGDAHKSRTGESAAYYTAAGTTTPQARSIEVTIEGGSTSTHPVRDGHFAILHKEATDQGLQPGRYTVRDAAGEVLLQGRIQ